MATARKVTWTTPTGKKRVRWQYSLQVNGKQDQRMFETREECEAALQDRQKEIREGRIYGVVTRKFGQVVEEYLAYKRAKGKRSVEEDDEILNRKLVPFFGADTKMVDLKDSRIADYERAKAVEINPRTERTLTTSTVNRHLSVLRCLLRLAKKWGYVREVPQIEMGKEPEGRLRYLEKDEAIRLLDACRESKKNPYLHSIVTVALYTGMRKGEILGLEWDRMDFSRGIILLEQTKSGKRREVPMSQAVHNVLSDLRKQQERVGEAPEGLVFRIRTELAYYPYKFPDWELRGIRDLRIYKDGRTLYHLPQYPLMLRKRASYLTDFKQEAEAAELFRKAQKLEQGLDFYRK